jgi:pimeloyl-ACP methyl ester carboxylesterase
MTSVLRRLALAGLALATTASLACAGEQMVEIPTRAGHFVRAIAIAPDSTPTAAVILLSGGDGLLNITADGLITSGANNQLVRTRADYARAGFLTLVPDIADDFKTGDKGVANGYRWSPEHAQDIGALVMWLRAKTARVHLVGTSRAALSVANAATRLAGAARPDTIVITSGMLMQVNTRQPSAERSVGNLDRITMPVLLMYHQDDACSVTPPGKVLPFKALLNASASVDVVMLSGGRTQGDPCEAMSYHGYLGIDGEVVTTVAAWLNSH